VRIVDALFAAPMVSDAPTWADKLEAWSTFGGAIVAFAAAAATIWLLIHQIRETRRARADATHERTEASADRALARQDRELAAAERRDVEQAQARSVVVGDAHFSFRQTGTGSLRLSAIEIEVTNFSSEPILAVRLSLDSDSGAGPWPTLVAGTAVLGPGQAIKEQGHLTDEPVVAAASTEEAYAAIDVVVEFLDAAGRRWRRTQGGQPERIFEHRA
jgi:hypothetical protein